MTLRARRHLDLWQRFAGSQKDYYTRHNYHERNEFVHGIVPKFNTLRYINYHYHYHNDGFAYSVMPVPSSDRSMVRAAAGKKKTKEKERKL